MAIQISPEIQARLAGIAEQGDYDSIDAILDEALTLFEERERFQHLRELLAVGAADIAAGRVIEYTPALLEEMKREARRRFDAGERAGPDVRP